MIPSVKSRPMRAARPPSSESLPPSLAGAAVEAPDLAVLFSQAGRDEIELALCRRTPAPDVACALAASPLLPLDSFLVNDVRSDPECALSCAAGSAGLHPVARAAVETDMRKLLSMFLAALPGRAVRLRMECIADDACRRFHQDRTGWRLLVTYRGPGTHWLAPESGTTGQVRTWDVLLLRGLRLGQTPRILHKSPPMPPGAPPRLLFVLDAAEAA